MMEIITRKSFWERHAEHVPVNYVAVSFGNYKHVMRKNNRCYHVKTVVRPQGSHHESLATHYEYGEIGPLVSTVGVEFKVLYYASAYVAWIEEIGGLSIWYENTHNSWVAPIVTFRDLKNDELSCEWSEWVEKSHC